jgi:predicted RNA binding protein YcfA (HicA-like mRNA interferase family)
MSRPDLSGSEVLNALVKHNFQFVRQQGSHAILKYRHPETNEVRTVTIPLHDSLKTGTLKSIADQAGAQDFYKFCVWIKNNS